MRIKSAARRSAERIWSAPSSRRSASPASTASSGEGARSGSRGSSSGSATGSRRHLRNCSIETMRAMPSRKPPSRSSSRSVRSRACARTKVSCVASSAAASSRRRSPTNRRTDGAWRWKITRNASGSPRRARPIKSRSGGTPPRPPGAGARSAGVTGTSKGDAMDRVVSLVSCAIWRPATACMRRAGRGAHAPRLPYPRH